MTIAYTDGNIVYGTGPMRPIVNLPSGVMKLRIRQRADCLTRAYLRFVDRIEQWEIGSDGENWRLEYLTATNHFA